VAESGGPQKDFHALSQTFQTYCVMCNELCQTGGFWYFFPATAMTSAFEGGKHQSKGCAAEKKKKTTD